VPKVSDHGTQLTEGLQDALPVGRIAAVQAHDNATAAEDKKKPQVPSAANLPALSNALGEPL
jgi:hypothetical protein